MNRQDGNGNLTLKMFQDQLDSGTAQLPSGDLIYGYVARKIVRHLWELLEAQKRALTRVMHENVVRDDCLRLAMKRLELFRCPDTDPIFAAETLDEICAKLAELETV